MIQATTPQTKTELVKEVRNCKTYFNAFKILIQIENDYSLKSSLGVEFDQIKTALVSTFNLDEGFMFPTSYISKDDLINYASISRRLKL